MCEAPRASDREAGGKVRRSRVLLSGVGRVGHSLFSTADDNGIRSRGKHLVS